MSKKVTGTTKTMGKKPPKTGKKNVTAKTSAPSKHLKPVEEGRNDHRIPINLLVDYRTNGTYLFDFCRDLGTGGVFIQTATPQPKGSHIDLTFTLPDSKETLQATGEVIWVQHAVDGRKDLAAGMGVQFAKFREDQRKTLEEFVSRYHSKRLNDGPPVTTKKPA